MSSQILCACGCGLPTSGRPSVRFVHGHGSAVRNIDLTYLEERVSKDPIRGCWLWQGSMTKGGYGQVSVSGKSHLAHRLSFELSHGKPIPEGAVVLHRCDIPACVNPAHLLCGSQAENLADMKAKGRALYGARNPSAKLTPETAALIRGAAGRLRDVAASFGVGLTTVADIKHGRRWVESAQ